MKKISLILLVLSLAFTLMSCASKPPAAGAASDVPPWLNDLPPADAIWGIGTAKQSSTSASLNAAESRARVAVGRQIQTKVQAMFTDYNLDAGNAKNQASSSLQEDVSRQITNIDVSGARPIQRWKGKDGAWWILVEVKKADVKKQVASILGNEEAAFAQFKAQQALQMMDAQLDKKDKAVVVDN
ncbi:hypothetical protein R84B8_02152 [Treponema sp. R8-4-B8]